MEREGFITPNATVNITNSIITGNTAWGIYTDGVYDTWSRVDTTITDSTISNNTTVVVCLLASAQAQRSSVQQLVGIQRVPAAESSFRQ